MRGYALEVRLIEWTKHPDMDTRQKILRYVYQSSFADTEKDAIAKFDALNRVNFQLGTEDRRIALLAAELGVRLHEKGHNLDYILEKVRGHFPCGQ